MDFDLDWYDYARILITLGAMLFIPGWALISTNDYWKRWKVLQRWIIATGISIAFYPVLFYWARVIFPGLMIGPNKNLAILIILGLWSAWKLRGHWREQFKFSGLELFALFIFGAILFTRYWIAYTNPFPAWSDSLHHTLLTELVGISGKLPHTLQPYAPTPLDLYHLGLYSLTGTVQQLAKVPAHTALLWTAQTLNGLCGLGIYLVLDRKVGRIGGIAGAIVVGLLSHMPAWYVNWGRFTQISSQTILLITWMITWDAIRFWRLSKKSTISKIFHSIIAGLLNTAVFLFHFRVAGIYLPLLFLTLGWEFFQSKTMADKKNLLIGIIFTGAIALFLFYPAGIPALRAYLISRTSSASGSNKDFSYFKFPLETVPQLVAKPWLLTLSLLGSIWVFVKRNKLGLLMITWVMALIGTGNLYRLKIPILNFTNQGAILIMLYIPMGIILGLAIADLYAAALAKFRSPPPLAMVLFLSVCLVAGSLGGLERIRSIEEYRYFMTDGDLQAMKWIKTNTPKNATFAISTFMWLNSLPHGIDGGYWIPYFTQRTTTSNTMLTPLERGDFYQQIFEQSSVAAKVTNDIQAIQELSNLGVKYIYIGQLQSQQFQTSQLFLEMDQLFDQQILQLRYHQSDVWIFEILL